MKLRNKKTGEIEEISFDTYYENGKYKRLCLNVLDLNSPDDYRCIAGYNSLAELTDEWEDYKPTEPLIKDEKIRKAIRAWSEADDLDNFRVQNQHFNECKIIGYTAGINKASFIGFQTTIAHADNKKLYTIAELCGEEEE